MENSKIEWTDHTFNPWHGCMKVSEGCKNCYAETLDKRWNGGHWGLNAPRKPMSEAYWNKPLIWDKAAKKAGVKAKVFCASMADVFEDHPDVIQWRKRLFMLIDSTPNLIWQLLTKRPENIMDFLPSYWSNRFIPDNVWFGTSVENQKAADERIPHLLKVPAKVRFLSCEPLLGPVDLTSIQQTPYPGFFGDCLQWYHRGQCHIDEKLIYPKIHWVIAGGESGHHSRPMHPDWARSLRDQCKAANVPFFFKQWGEWHESDLQERPEITIQNRHLFIGGKLMYKVGKKEAGSLLDGVEHKEFPI